TGTPVVPPLGAATTTPAGTAKPAGGGAATDAGAAADGGKAAPVPTPTFQLPTALPTIPGFDAGAFKPPPGFPTTLPTFPPPAPSK
ncbi:MAG: hypothetical protein JWP97_6801, partial [Labilithrix sp.]|nr:hypothetical protein [Labilithrix sp.]